MGFGQVEVGKWFFSTGWGVFPSTLLLRAQADFQKAKGPKLRSPRFRTSSQPVSRSEAEKLTRSLIQETRHALQARSRYYNAHPHWSLADVKVNSLTESSEVIVEFFHLVKCAAAEFCWPLNYPEKDMRWKQHSWTHTTFSTIESVIAEVRRGTWLPPESILDLIGSRKEARELFLRAARKEPEAVARIGSLFASEDDRNTAARALFMPTDPVPRILSVGDLAAELAERAGRHPDSAEAESARRNLNQLVSKHAVKGSKSRGGRPSSPHHKEIVLVVWMMCYSICKQMREVDRFLENIEKDASKRRPQLTQLYPWVSAKLHKDALNFLKDGNTSCALDLTGSLLELSPSKVQKVVYAARP
jgi:hypothetical protein